MIWKWCTLFCCLCLSMLIFVPEMCFAVLGGTVDSIDSDKTFLSAAKVRVESTRAYTIHEIDSDGTIVREFVSSNGIVFAIAWTGARTPDLGTLLGSYAAPYNQALARTPRSPGVRHLSIEGSDIVVERGGQVGNLQGRAYAPSLMPTGVNADEIR